MAIPRSVLPGALWLVLLAAPAAAQEPPRTVNFGIGGGLSVPVGDARDVYKNGFNGQVYVRVDVAKWPVSLRGDFSYQIFQLHGSALAGTGSDSGTGTLLGGLAGVQWDIVRTGRARPYLIAAAGVYNVKSEPDVAPAPTPSATHFGWNGGAGILFNVGSLMLYAEGRFDHVRNGGDVVPTDALGIVPISLGVIF